MKFSHLFISIILALSFFLFMGCSTDTTLKDQTAMVSPFTEITWENKLEDVIKLEGDQYESYASVYSGTTYAFPKEYLNLEGTIKYMFDGDGALMCIAWAYGSDSLNSLTKLYNKIHSDVEETYGESGYNPNSPTNFGDVWKLDSGHIILSVMNTNTQKALQYSYQNPLISDDTQPKE